MPDFDIKHIQKNIDYLNPLLPYSVTKTTMENGYPDVLFHWHTDMEVIYVHEGRAQFHIAYDYFTSQPGDIILIKPNALHSIHPIGNERHVFSSLTFHLDMVGFSTKDQISLRYLQPLYKGELGLQMVVKPDHPSYRKLKETFLAIDQVPTAAEKYSELWVKTKLHELLFHIFNGQLAFSKAIGQNSYRREDKIRLVLDYISHNYQRELTIQELADLCGYSSAHFMNFFKRHLNMTCMDYLIQFRLKTACELLDHSNATVMEIAQRVGFNNLSNFNRQFKKYYQQSPSQYRKNRSTTSRVILTDEEKNQIT